MFSVLVAMLIGAGPAPAEAQAPDTVVVCPAAFGDALKPWLEFRRRQGHVLTVVSGAGGEAEIRRQIARVAEQGRLKFVVLVGDAPSGFEPDEDAPARCVPVHYAEAKVNVLWGSEAHIATDNPYADLDDDGTPELAIGRLTADTPEELKAIVGKILGYEQSRDFGPWRRRLNFVAGVGGFGMLADAALETGARYVLTRDVPPEYRLSMTYGSWRSPYCPDPRQFHATALKRLNEGSWFWVYIGHGMQHGVDRVRVPGQTYPILNAADVPRLDCEHGAPLAVFLACYAGAVDAREDCLAEEMLAQPGGPVAVFAGSRVTMPYAMTVMSTGLMNELFGNRCPTVGEAVLRAKRKLVEQPKSTDSGRVVLDTIARLISPAGDKLAEERAEHVLLFNLFGDPLLRLRYPKPVELDVPGRAVAGAALRVAGSSPVDGRAQVELVVPNGQLTFKQPLRTQYPSTSGDLAAFQEVYEKANDPRLTSVETTVSGGRFAAALSVPAQAGGKCLVRVFIEGSDDFAMGAAEVTVEKPQE